MSLALECVIFSALYIYKIILQSSQQGEDCNGTGTSLGALVMAPIYISSATCTLFGGLLLGAYALHLLQLCLKRICCCFGPPMLTGTSLAKIPYIERYFTTCTDSCAICLGDFQRDEIVSPLHCDIKHVFHTACIKHWLVRNPICPLCKAEICPKKLKEFNRSAVRRLKQASEE